MSEPTSGTKPPVKIYDRPVSKGISPMIIVIAVIAVLVAGLLTYRFMHMQQARKAQTSFIFPARATSSMPIAIGLGAYR